MTGSAEEKPDTPPEPQGTVDGSKEKVTGGDPAPGGESLSDQALDKGAAVLS